MFDSARVALFNVKDSFEHHMNGGSMRPAGFKGYVIFKGHADILGHYYRHLSQTTKYITRQIHLNDDRKYEYIKTLRAQLSNFEQLMLYYNGIALFPGIWYELFADYRFIKNIHLDLAVFGQPPHLRYSDEMRDLWKRKKQKMFENQPPIVLFQDVLDDDSDAPGQLI